MAKTRVFNGRSYYRHQWFSSKARARDYAERMKGKGYKARVVPQLDNYGEKGWALYLRK